MKWLSWLAVIVVCLAVASGLGLYKYNDIQAAIQRGKSFPEPVEAVEVYIVEQVSRRPSLTVTGEVVATQSATLRNELRGYIVKVGFAPGASVKKGKVLLQLDVSQERAQLAEARANLKIAQLALERTEYLVTTRAGSVEARDQAKAQAEAAQARVDALIALIDKKTLRAPFDAITSLHQLEIGQFLDAGTAITELVGVSDHVWIDFALPQDNAQIPVGNTVQIRVDNTQPPSQAEIIARDASINVRSRNLRLRAQLSTSTETALLPGMLVQVTVPLASAQTATVVPATAVRRDAMGISVYVLEPVTENGQQKVRARRRNVELTTIRGTALDAKAASEMVVVAEGLEPGEQIAAIGAFKLRDGVLVAPNEPDPSAAERVVGR